jgi:hypothetical protein
METRRSVSRRARDVIGNSFFSGSSGIRPNLLVTHERLLYVDHVRYVWSETIRRLSVGCVWCIGRVSLVGCTSI